MGRQEQDVQMVTVIPDRMSREWLWSDEPPEGSRMPVLDSELWPQTRTATSPIMGTQLWDSDDATLKANPGQIREIGESVHTSKGKSQALSDEKLKGLHKLFHPRKQLRRLLLDGLARWSLTAMLILCLYLTLWHYSAMEVMSRAQKLQFNGLVTGLSIALALSIASSLKEIALEARWWILSRKKRSIYEVDLILHSDSPAHLFRLLMASPRVSVILVVLLWLLLNLGAQIGVALLSLTYSVDSAGTFALTAHGNVSIPDMSALATTNIVSAPHSNIEGDRALHYTANSFGVLALAFGYDDIDTKPKPHALYSSDNAFIFVDDDYAQYVFYDTTPDGSISIATNRTINSTGICNSWPVIDGGDGSKPNITIMLNSLGEKKNLYIPITAGLNQTTYVTHQSKSCGDGCSIVAALETSDETPFYYECNVTVAKVDHGTRPEHEVSSSLRSLAASAIALQGYVSPSVTNSTDLLFQTYPVQFTYGSAQNGSTTQMGLQMAEFAMGVIAVAAQNNPVITVPGDQPQTGVTLNVSEWKYVHLILGLTAGLQLLLFLVAAFFSNRAIVKDNSHLAVARLLRPFVEQLGPSGGIATGKEISDAFGQESKFIYSVDQTWQSHLLRLGMGEQKPVRRFPKGLYS